MKLKHTLLPCAAVLLILGCDSGKQPETPPAPEAASVPGDASAPLKAVAETKEAFAAAVEKQLADLDAKISELRKKSEGYKDDAKVAADQALASLSEQRTKAGAKLEELKKAGADVWKDVKTGVDAAIAELEKAYAAAKAKFS